jgi:ABC-type transport system involved in cytochrome c biogenesis permease subunit
MLSILYGIAFFFYFLAFLMNMIHRRGLESLAGFVALVSTGLALIIILWTATNFPVFNLFEALLLVSFTLGLLCLFPFGASGREAGLKKFVWAEILLLFLIMLFTPKISSPDQFDHDDLYVISFHGFRMLALGFMLFASAHFIRSGNGPNRRHEYIRKGRDYLLLGTLFFLISEFAGIIWCQNGWGDFWHWSQGFFQSTLIVVYMMFVFHIPGKNSKSDRIRILTGGMGGFFVTALVLIRHLL